MIRCSRCIYPKTKPEIHFDEDHVCSACRTYAGRSSIDWDARKSELVSIFDKHTREPYDCIVPVSGGKDSTYQVLKVIRDFGPRPLIVNAATDYLTPEGRANIDNLKRYGDVLEITPNVETRKNLCRIGLFEVGDLSWPEHNLIWTVPFRIAKRMGISLIVYGENPQSEYGGPPGTEQNDRLDQRWRSEFGGFLGMRTADIVGKLDITERELYWYTFPEDTQGVEAIWLGRYLPWNGATNAIYAGAFGFRGRSETIETSLGTWENVDNYATIPRDWLRFVKYGFSRATDIACNHIRRGWLTRDEGLELSRVRERFPKTSLGKPIKDVLAYFDVTLEEYVRVCDSFTNPAIFKTYLEQDRSGNEQKGYPIVRLPVKDPDGTPVMIG